MVRQAALAIVLVGFLGASVRAAEGDAGGAGASDNKSLAQQRARKIGPDLYQLGAVTINAKERTLRFAGKVNMDKGGAMPVEVLACLPMGKVHESVLTVDVDALDVQLSLLLLGLEPGRNPGVPRPNESPGADAPVGDMVDIYVEWNKDGAREGEHENVRHRAEELLYNVALKKVVPRTQWVFVGSYWSEGKFYASLEGTIVSTFCDAGAILELPTENVTDDTWGIVNDKLCPPVGTPVELIVQVPAPKDNDGDDGYVELYTGYGTQEQVLVRGRAMEEAPPNEPEGGGSATGNMVRAVKMLHSEDLEEKEVTVACEGRAAKGRTNEEGDFNIWIESGPQPFTAGDLAIEARVQVAREKVMVARGMALVRPRSISRVIVCDLDDTIIETRMEDRLSAGWKTLTGDSTRMKPVSGMNNMLSALAAPARSSDQAALVSYVSGGPVNFYPRLQAFLNKNNFPQGVLILRNFGFGRDNDSWSVTKYKTGEIESLLKTFSDGKFILVGDSGQTDPEIYSAIRERHAGRIAAILIRQVGDDDAEKSKDRLKDMIGFKDGDAALKACQKAGLIPVDGPQQQQDKGPAEGGQK